MEQKNNTQVFSMIYFPLNSLPFGINKEGKVEPLFKMFISDLKYPKEITSNNEQQCLDQLSVLPD
jgi:hypothetical protein